MARFPTTKSLETLKQVGLVLDFEGYCVDSNFVIREVAWCNHDGTQCDSYHYYPSKPYPRHDPNACKTIDYVYHRIHGLPYNPPQRCRSPRHLAKDFLELYSNLPTDRPYVAYKGGHFEKNFLHRLGIPSFNLELIGCPKFNDMTRLATIASCGYHLDPFRHHCPKVECYLLYNGSEPSKDCPAT